MIKRLKRMITDLPLASKIRISYFVVLVPTIILMIIFLNSLIKSNRTYESMIESAVVASDFSLDFKKDFDYETYLVIVGNKTFEESGLDELLDKANEVVKELEGISVSSDNADRIEAIKKYLVNLETYKTRIADNLSVGNRYAENIEIWENDVQIVTGLIRESILQYIYYEMEALDEARAEYQKFNVGLIRTTVIALLVITIVTMALSIIISRSITSPIRRISAVTDKVAKGDLSVRSNVRSSDEVGVLSDSLNTMIDKINDLIKQVTTEQISLRKTELELLQAQINPHFLYNTLDTIIWLAEGNNEKEVVHMVKSLSDFFRAALNEGRDVVPVRDELVHVRSYLEIQQVRYQDILSFDINVPDSVTDYAIPKISLQPLVENALYHGIKNKRGGGKISVFADEDENSFSVYVKDDGIGMTPERLSKVREGIKGSEKGGAMFGLYSVNERIRLKFEGDYGISIESVYNEGTTVRVRLPKQFTTSTV